MIVMMERKFGFIKLMIIIGIVKMEKMNIGLIIVGIPGMERFIFWKANTITFQDMLI